MQPMVSGDSIVIAAEGQVSCTLGEEVAILDLQAGVYYGLNALGARIWHLLQAATTVNEVRDALLAEYDIEPGHCERDLLALLWDLAERGLIEVRKGNE